MHAPQNLESAVALCLREPLAVSRRLLKLNNSFIAALEQRRNRAMSSNYLARHLSRFLFPQQEQVDALLREDPRSRIIAAFHLGDYIYGMHLFATRFSCDWQFSYLSLERGSAAYFANLQTAFGENALACEAQQLRAQTTTQNLAATLRKSFQCLVLFCDLPEKPESSIAANLFHRPARFSRGPATLALVNRVPILPVIVFKLDGRDRIFVEPQLEPLLEPGETLAVAVRRVTQSLVELLEKYLILDPTQWRYLKLLPRYFVQTESSSSVTD